VLTTDQKGAIAELAVAHAAAVLGVGVFKPLTDGERYDLILDVGASLLRTQCKWARRCGNVVVVPCYSARRARDGLRKRVYRASEVDAIAAHCAEIDRAFLLFAEEFDGRSAVQLRLAPSRNNQRLGINWADDFDFDARLMTLLGP
jgi:hypothetical protein